MFKKLLVGAVSSVLLAGILSVTAYASNDDKIVQHQNSHNDRKFSTNEQARNDQVVQYEERFNDKIVQHQNLHNDRKFATNEQARNDKNAQYVAVHNDKIMQYINSHND